MQEPVTGLHHPGAAVTATRLLPTAGTRARSLTWLQVRFLPCESPLIITFAVSAGGGPWHQFKILQTSFFDTNATVSTTIGPADVYGVVGMTAAGTKVYSCVRCGCFVVAAPWA